MITYTRSTSEEELKQVLQLQQRNLPVSVSEADQKTEGFVTVVHDLELLKAMHDTCPHILAKDGDTVVGYALSMHPDFGERIEVLKPMFEQINTILNSPQPMPQQLRHDFVVMGQICVDKAYRKQGIFRNLYTTMRVQLLPPFSAIITEVDAKNERSLNAHYAVGFEELGNYTAGGQEWVLLSLK
ncbi:GNAT family N-acetyltransferase [Rasiella sp. SM2506]|uniref:GNAT family N-acetyltransferase n=1 Tax=Rasiella sp. SM2506 TaxID=3423914 RepID=UPI003D7AE995